MVVSTRTKFILTSRAGGKCAFADCRKDVVQRVEGKDDFIVTGEVAHIVGQQENGPRGKYSFERCKIDEYENLILLCEQHHKLIDACPEVYPVEKLHQIKDDHERWVSSTLSKEQLFLGIKTPHEFVVDRVQSTLLPIINIPLSVFSAPCNLDEEEVKKEVVLPEDKKVMLPYLVRSKQLLTFDDLRKSTSPFRRVIDPYTAKRHEAIPWWDDPDQSRWYMTLLNRSLNKLTGRLDLNLDKTHGRYYFEPISGSEEEGHKSRTIQYQTLTGKRSERSVAWKPSFRYKGGYKNYWEHMAVSLFFHRVDSESWCLSIRPERRFTRDGYAPLTPKGIGKRSTSRHARQYNIDVLKEVQFWREYLSNGSPRIVFNYGTQSLIIENEMISSELSWPGVPDDAKPATKLRHTDNLFSWVELHHALNDVFDEEEDFEEEDQVDDCD